MQRFLIPLLVIMLSLASSNSSAQQFESFRFIGEATSTAAGTVTSVTLAETDSKLSYFNAAGLSTIYDITFEPSQIIRDGIPVYMPANDFSNTEDSMNLTGVSFFTGTLTNAEDPQSDVPAHWFRMTVHNGVWSGAFRIADRIYAIDRSRRDNIVEVRATPSQNTWLQPSRQIKVSAVIDEEFVFADAPGDSLGMDHLGHVHALESLHIMDGVMNDSLGMTARLEQLIYQSSDVLTTPATWIADNATAFGIEDNYATILFRGDESIQNSSASNYLVQSQKDFAQLATAHGFGKLLGIAEEDGTLQSPQDPLQAAHWSDLQKAMLLENLPNASMVRIISSDAPPIEVTEPDEPINEIPQHILDSEIVESNDPTSANTETDSETNSQSNSGAAGSGLLQNDAQSDNTSQTVATDGGGQLSYTSLLSLVLLMMLSLGRRSGYRRRQA